MTFEGEGRRATKDAFEQALLDSARRDEPTGDAAKAAWAKFAAATTAVGASASPGGPAGSGRLTDGGVASAARLAAAKWLAIGAIGGGALTAALLGSRLGAPAAPAPPVSSTLTTPTPPVVASTNVPERAPAAIASAGPVAIVKDVATSSSAKAKVTDLRDAASPSPVSRASTLAAQAAAVDRARAATWAGNHDEGLRLVARYHEEFPAGELAPDAEAVAIVALAGKGDRAELTRRASLFLARYPHDPHAAAVRKAAGD
jgi:hypothetical protein